MRNASASTAAVSYTHLLRDVRYVIEAHFDILPEKAAPEDNAGKFQDIAKRRIRRGQFYHQPCFGCREFPCLLYTSRCV